MSDAVDTPRRPRWRRFSPSMGWHAFWSEILIVAVGVVIALAANAVAEDWSWRHRVADAEARLQGDLAWAFLWTAEKYATHPCVDAQLTALARRVMDSGATLDPAPVLASNGMQYLVRIPNRPYRFPTWDALVADGTATHFTATRQAALGRISDSMALARENESETSQLMDQLLLMREPIALDAGVRAELLTRIHALRSMGDAQALRALQRMGYIAEAGNAPRAAVVDAFLFGNQTFSAAESSGSVRYCKAQGLPLASWRDYGQASRSTGFDPTAKAAK